MNHGYPQNYCTPGVPNYSPGMPGYTPGVPNCSPGMSNYTPGMPGYTPGVPNCPLSVPHYTPGIPNFSPSVPHYSPAVPNYSPSVPNYTHGVPNQHEVFYSPPVEPGIISCPAGQPGMICSDTEPGIPYPSAPPVIMAYPSYPTSSYTPGAPNRYPY